MNRVLVLAVAVLVGAAAPVRAWCESSCITPSTDTSSHCPTHEPASDTAAMSAQDLDDCPTVEAARPATAKIEFISATPTTPWHPAPKHPGTPAPRHLGTPAPRHPGTLIPLRI